MRHTSLLITGAVLLILSIILGSIWNQYFIVGHGIKIVGFMKGSPAQKAGMFENDAIVGIDGKQIRTTFDFVQFMKSKKAADVVIVQTLRGIITVVLGKDAVFGSARMGVYVETIQSIKSLPAYS